MNTQIRPYENMELTMANKHKSAFTLVEVLLSLAILGMLMAAVAVAFDASVKNYQANEGIYRAVNTGRQTLLRITNDVRTAENVLKLGVPGGDPPTHLTLRNADGNDITYVYSTTDDTVNGLEKNTLYLFTEGGMKYKLCENISSMTFNRTTEPVRNVRIKMKITDPDSGVTQTLVAAAVVRRNLGD